MKGKHTQQNIKGSPMPNVSEGAKSLVRQMLEPDPKKTLTAKQVLSNCIFSSF